VLPPSQSISSDSIRHCRRCLPAGPGQHWHSATPIHPFFLIVILFSLIGASARRSSVRSCFQLLSQCDPVPKALRAPRTEALFFAFPSLAPSHLPRAQERREFPLFFFFSISWLPHCQMRWPPGRRSLFLLGFFFFFVVFFFFLWVFFLWVVFFCGFVFVVFVGGGLLFKANNSLLARNIYLLSFPLSSMYLSS